MYIYRVEKIESHFAYIDSSCYINEYHDDLKFIELCKNCQNYGKRWSCPPFERGENLEIYNYKHLYILGSKIIIDEKLRELGDDDGDLGKVCGEILIPVRRLLDRKLLEVERAKNGRKVFFAGSCKRCGEQQCSREVGEPCREANDLRISLESAGFDVGKTTSKLLGIELKWGGERKLPQYFTLVSAIFSDSEISADELNCLEFL